MVFLNNRWLVKPYLLEEQFKASGTGKTIFSIPVLLFIIRFLFCLPPPY